MFAVKFKPCGSIVRLSALDEVCMGEPAQSIQALKETTDFVVSAQSNDSADCTDLFVSSISGSRGTARRKGQKQIRPHENGAMPNLNHYASSLLYPTLPLNVSVACEARSVLSEQSEPQTTY